MKAGTFMIICAALIASGIAIQADDTADQAAARAALEQKFYQLDHPEAPPPTDTNSTAVLAQPAESATTVTNAASATPAQATKVPAAVAPAKAAPTSTAPADADFAQKIPAADASAQAAALAALNEKMNELSAPEAQPPPVTHSTATTATAPMVAPLHEPSAAATPVTEAPTAEAPVAVNSRDGSRRGCSGFRCSGGCRAGSQSFHGTRGGGFGCRRSGCHPGAGDVASQRSARRGTGSAPIAIRFTGAGETGQ